MHQSKFNILIYDLTKQILNYSGNFNILTFIEDVTELKTRLELVVKGLHKQIFSQLFGQLNQEIKFILNKMIKTLPKETDPEKLMKALEQWKAASAQQIVGQFLPQKIEDFKLMLHSDKLNA